MATISNVARPGYVYDAGADTWYPIGASAQVNMTIFEYTATAAQTEFTGSDDNSKTLDYTPNSIIVTLNGVVLSPGDDYTATNGSTVTLASGAALNDVLNVVAFSTFDVANTYTQAEIDQKISNVEALALLGL